MTEQAATAPAPEPTKPQPGAQKAKPQPQMKFLNPIRWLRRHHRLLTFVGALIVFGTFLAREGLRENLKESVDSIENAESIFLIREDIRRANTHTAERQEELTQVEFKNMERLIEKLQKPELKNNIDDIDKQLEAVYDFVHEASDYVDSHHSLSEEKVHEFQAHATEEADRMQIRVNSNIDTFAQRLDEEATRARDRAEHGYKRATWASYFLYALGWGLGLVGRLVGVETGAGE